MHTTCHLFKDFISIKRKLNAHLRMFEKKNQYKSRRSLTIIIAVVNIRVKNLILYKSQVRLHMTENKQSFPEIELFKHQADWFLILYIYTGVLNLFPIKLT
jgi:hypothetical protein